jgi:hypothetical protein
VPQGGGAKANPKQTEKEELMVWQKSSILSLIVIGLLGLTTAVPAQAQTCVPPPAGLISWWPGDGDATDIIGPNNGTLHDSATFAKGLVGQAFSFDGSGAFVDAATVGLPIGNSNRTLEMWIRIERFVPGVREVFFAGYGGFGTFNAAYVLGTTSAGCPDLGCLFFSQWGDIIIGPPLMPETWYHIAVTNAGNQVTLYLDGIAVRQGPLAIMTASNARFNMGSIPPPFGDERRLDGLVDEVSIYNRVLSPDEIHSIFAARSAGKCHQVPDVDVPGNLTMRNSTGPTVGNILKAGVPFIHNFGDRNTFIGSNAGNLTMSGSRNSASGANALFNNTTGSSNTAAGESALLSNTTGNFNTAVGRGADVSMGNFTNATAIGFQAVVDASNKIRLGNEAVTVIEGLVGFTANSDRNRQEIFRPVRGEEVLRKIRRMSLTSWNFIGQDPGQFRHYGPSAQDFFDAFGHDGVGTIGTPTTITSSDIEGILMIAVQALERRNEDLNEQIDALTSRLEALERMVSVGR